MCELLVSAKAHWLDEVNPDTIPIKKLEQYYARSEIGDIISIAPDGHIWGKEECLPYYVVVKIPGLSVDEYRYLTEPLIAIVPDEASLDGVRVVLSKRRKYMVNKLYIKNLIALQKDSITINLAVLNANILEK